MGHKPLLCLLRLSQPSCAGHIVRSLVLKIHLGRISSLDKWEKKSLFNVCLSKLDLYFKFIHLFKTAYT